MAMTKDMRLKKCIMRKENLPKGYKTEINNNGEEKINKLRSARSIIKLGTWNTRSIKGKENEIVEEMKVQGIDYLGVTEIRRKGKGIKELREGYIMYWSGVGFNERGAEGVGLIVKADKVTNIIEEWYVSERIFVAEIRLDRKKSWTVIVAYAPNDNARVEEKEIFFRDLQAVIDNGRTNIIIMGDMNGRVGNENQGIERYMGPFGEKW